MRARATPGATISQFRRGGLRGAAVPRRVVRHVVSFETIEHIAAQDAFLDEVRRVLRPDGFVVLSCPNKAEYADARDHVNEFHVRELYRDEFAALVAARFPHVAWYGQRPGFFSVVWPEHGGAQAEIFEVAETARRRAVAGPRATALFPRAREPAVRETLAALTPRLSVLADRDEWVYRDYANVTRAFVAAQKRESASSAELAAVQARVDEAVRQRDAAVAALRGRARAAGARRCARARGGRAPRELPLVARAPVAPTGPCAEGAAAGRLGRNLRSVRPPYHPRESRHRGVGLRTRSRSLAPPSKLGAPARRSRVPPARRSRR